MQIKQEMLVYDTLIIMDKLGLLEILQLKGGHCARCHLPIFKHRYSNDLDFNLLEPKEKNTEKLYELILNDFNRFFISNNLQSVIKKRKDNSILILTRSVVSGRIPNAVIIEVNKEMPYLKAVKGTVKTHLDMDRVGFSEVIANVFTPEEFLGEKLFICGRRNGHRDAFDIYAITEEYPRFRDDLPELVVKRFLQRCKLDNKDPKETVNANKKALLKRLYLAPKIAELKSMSFQKISSDFIKKAIRLRVSHTLDLLLQ